MRGPGGPGSSWWAQHPGVLGINILRRCYQELFGQHGPALFSLPSVSEALKMMVQALQHCCQVSAEPVQDRAGKI